jgi:Rrf2 family iron-sulfur cluster assembly transcriptional regulator
MRISTKGRHAVMAMVDLARHAKEKPVALAEIALRQEISLSYLEQLVAMLKSRDLVKSHRGPGGGYMLRLPSESITVHDIISAVDDTTPRIYIHDPLTATGRQLTDLLWQAIGDEVSAYLKTVTLADVTNCTLCTKEDNHGTTEADDMELPIPPNGQHEAA